MNAVLMDGVVVGESSIVAAMSFVKAGVEIEPGMLVAGTPAKVIRQLREEEIIWKSDGTADYQRLAVRSAASMVECSPLSAVENNRARLKVGDTVPKYQSGS